MKVLIVDDGPLNLKLLRAELEADGHAVRDAPDGVEALALLNQEPFDAIISDILMPRMDGYRLCQEVRQSPRLHALPFIFFTATYLSPDDEKLCMDMGADKYLRKSATAEEILAALHEVTASGGARRSRLAALPAEATVMTEYNARLVAKLEQKNLELQTALAELQRAHDRIADLNVALERRVAERTAELQAANSELEAFSYSVSHDLRAPLRAIGGFAGMVQRDCHAMLPPKSLRQLQQVISSAEQMNRLVDALLKFSRFNRQPLAKQPVVMSRLVEEVMQELRAESGGGSVEVKVGPLPDCQADSALLRQVLVNLLSNAFKFTRGKAPRVVEVECREQTGEKIYVVRDNGAGFDMKYARKLFGGFQRMHRSEEFEGTGVGLSIVQRIIQRHGGRVWAEAAVDKGATFYFTLAKPE